MTPEEAYLHNRWEAQYRFYLRRASIYRTRSQILRLVSIVALTLIPVLLNLNASLLLSLALSFIVAAVLVLENTYTFTRRWRADRETTSALQSERSLYEAGEGPYRNPKTAFRRFVDRTETIIARAANHAYLPDERVASEPEEAPTAPATTQEKPRRWPTNTRIHHHIFISYSHQNMETMKRILGDLEAEGFQVWTDANLTPGTESWQRAISQALKRAGCLLAILSPDAEQSEWCDKELAMARTLELPIFPVLAQGDEKTAIPFSLITSQWVDIRTDYSGQMPRLIDAISTHLHPLVMQ